MDYKRMPIEIESPEEFGYDKIKYNLTESSYSDAYLKDLDLDLSSVLLSYGDHRGNLKLRELVANQAGVTPQDVLITTGASSALFIIATSLLKTNDEVIVDFPNYATNIETPRALGAKLIPIKRDFESKFQLNIERFKKQINPSTKIVSITTPHNPTGVVTPQSDLKILSEHCRTMGSYLILDETYGEMNFAEQPPQLNEFGDHVISVSSLSKTYGLPGIRIGWILCKNKELMETFLAAKEQIFITGSTVDEEIALRFLKNKNTALETIKKDMLLKKDILMKWLKTEIRVEAIEPNGGVVAFPRIKNITPQDLESFYKTLTEEYQTFVGPGHWFEMDKSYMRIGFGWPTQAELQEGLNCISKALDKVTKPI